MEDNLKLWESVEKTNPNYTKKANVKGNNITSIAPQFQILQATKQWGSYGGAWGLKNHEFDYSLKDIGMITFKATFYYPEGDFEIVNSVQLFKDGAKLKIDDDFAKKVETDTLTKAMSKLGFNADIFLGKFDDVKYLTEVTKEFAEKEPKKKLDNDGIKFLREKGTLEQLNQALNERELTTVQKEVIDELIKKLK